MESLSPQVVAVAKLPILNPNEFYLWKMRIEQYFLMTDYSLWEVILNGDSPIPTRIVDDVMSLMEAIEKRFGGNKETKKKLISQLEILGESLSQEDINLKFLRSLPSEWRTHTLIWRNRADLQDQSLDHLFNNLKIYEAEVKSSSSTSHATQNIAFVSSQNTDSTNEPVSAVTSVSAASTKPPASILPNVDNLNADDLEEMGLKWQMAMLTIRARRFLQRTRRNLGANGTTSIGFDMSKCDGVVSHDWSFQADEEPTNYALMTFTSSSSTSSLGSDSEEEIKERDELKHTLENFQTSSKNLSKLLDSQINDETGLSYDNQVFNSTLFDSDELTSSESDVSVPTSPVHDSETVLNVLIVKPSPTKPTKDMSQSNRPSAPIIEDWISDSEDEYEGEPMPIQKAPSFVQTSKHVKNPRTSVKPGNPQLALKDKGIIDSGCSRHMTRNISYLSDFEKINGGYVVFGGNPKGSKITGKDTECVVLSSDFKLPDENYMLLRVPRENNMYNIDLKNIVPSGDLTCLFAQGLREREFSVARTPQQNEVAERKNRTLIEATRTMLADSLLPIPFWAEAVNTACYVQNRADEGFLVGYYVSSKAFRVFNIRTRIVQETLHINFLENQPNVLESGPIWLFDIDTLTQSMNYQPVVTGNRLNSSAGIQENLDAGKVGKEHVSTQQYVLLPLWFTGSKDPQNRDADAAFDDKDNKSAVHVSPNLSIGVRDLSDEFEEFFVNSTNKVNAASPPVTAVEPNSTNNTNSFNAPGPFDNAVSTFFEIGGKYSFVDPSQYPDDPYMPDLEDIVYLDDEENVGAEAGFSNLETSITGHTQEEGIDYEEVFALVARIEAIRAWYETLANYLLENGFQRGKIEQTLFIKKQKGDILLVQVYVDNIIFGYTNKELCKGFEKLMKDKFQMSLIGELTFFLGLQVKQKDNRIFISQDKYVAEILRKFGLTDGKSASTPIDTEKPLLKDPDDEDVDVHIYRHFRNAVSSKLMLFGLTIDAAYLMLLGHKSNDDVRLQALIDRKKVIITDDTIRQALRLDDAAGVDCLPMVKNMDSPLKFLMYSRFLQLMTIAQVDDLSFHNTKYTSPALTQKVFANMRRTGKGFSGVHTPLFDETCATLTKQVANLEQDKIAQAIEITKLKQRVRRLEKKRQFKSLRLKRLKKVEIAQRVESSADTVMDNQEYASKQGGEDTDKAEPVEVEEVIEVVTVAKLMTKVVTTVATTITAAQVPKASAPRRRRGVVIQDLEEITTASVIVHSKVKYKDKGKGILIEEPKPLKRQAQIEQDKAFAR
uniref:Putative ribonuclease H-like domain-containing protein n=1 Tax=Tanacetum cinerariifolium TaxID=118510 RepID=A0A6L2JXX6_TANCI|nr:putative ribonuclease H-like domain-containing protein [Tanacetum cinerariifolium]